jgi:predicted regulator of Ras-like GTPase activity (Roadblock/LC7/MglB family)
VIGRLVREANAKGVFVVDKNGQLIAEAGEVRGIDSTSLASLTAGSIDATGGLAKIIGEEDFPIHFHQGVRDNLHITTVAKRMILVVIFDERSSLGLVLRVKKAGPSSSSSSTRSASAPNPKAARPPAPSPTSPMTTSTTSSRTELDLPCLSSTTPRARSTARSSTTARACAARRPTSSTSTPRPTPS